MHIISLVSCLGQKQTPHLIRYLLADAGGVMVMGDRGTGKSTTVRALTDLLPQIQVGRGSQTCHRAVSVPTAPPSFPLASAAAPTAEMHPSCCQSFAAREGNPPSVGLFLGAYTTSALCQEQHTMQAVERLLSAS